MSKDIPIRPRYGISENVEKINNDGEAKCFGQCDTINIITNDSESNVEFVDRKNKMFHFVTDNLEEKLRQNKLENRSTCDKKMRSSSATTDALAHLVHTPLIPQIDPNVLNDIEIEAQYLATSVDNITENLCNLLHSISSITADNVEVHKISVDKITDSIDANIKCMYTIMAKTEEISKSMQPTERLGTRIREIRRLIDTLDNII